jgi:hypothetical protein
LPLTASSPTPAVEHPASWKKALREAERELEAATRRTALDAAAKKLMSSNGMLCTI